MSGYLLDTNVVSDLAPGKPGVSKLFAAWMQHQGQQNGLFISSITVSEIKKGVSKLRRSGAERRADALDVWLSDLVFNFADRILPIDVAVALAAGEMADAATAKGRDPGFADILIAATANAHGLTLVTRNIKHFENLDVATQRPAGNA